ncbi:hypothetical protein D3C73_929860 [compost metagenome]
MGGAEEDAALKRGMASAQNAVDQGENAQRQRRHAVADPGQPPGQCGLILDIAGMPGRGGEPCPEIRDLFLLKFEFVLQLRLSNLDGAVCIDQAVRVCA